MVRTAVNVLLVGDQPGKPGEQRISCLRSCFEASSDRRPGALEFAKTEVA